jgi:hypothetical protein
MAPPIGVRDGARGVEQLGFVSKAIMRFDGKGSYFIESQGRVGFKIFDSPFLPPVGVDMSKSQFTGEPGESGTFAGRRAKKHQLRQTASLITAGAVTSAQRAKYEEQWEMVGDWSRVPWGAGFRELWGGAVAFRNADGTINNRFGLELWIPDAMGGPDGQGVIYYVNQWPAHPAKRTLAQFPPKGYTDAGTVTGQADVVPFLTHEQWPDYVNQPFDMELGPDGKLYWINFGNHSLCRCDLDGGNPEEVVSCSIGVVDGPLGIPYRLADATMATDQIRALYVKDGPFGTATLMYPQTMRFTSKGTIVIGERYTYALREVDLTARTVRTIAYIPNLAFAGTSSGCNDLGMDVDHAGTCGPVDDIFVSVWLRNYRFGLDGTYRGYPFTPAGAGYMSNGPLPRIQCPVYAWTPGVGNGRIFFVGSGGGHQAIEITKRQTGDVGPDSNADYTKWTAGRVAFQNSPMYLTHGCALQGRLGYPSIEEIGSWTEATLRSYATTWGISAANMDNFVYFARMGSMDYDYAVDTTAPAKPVNALSESSITWS